MQKRRKFSFEATDKVKVVADDSYLTDGVRKGDEFIVNQYDEEWGVILTTCGRILEPHHVSKVKKNYTDNVVNVDFKTKVRVQA